LKNNKSLVILIIGTHFIAFSKFLRLIHQNQSTEEVIVLHM